MGWRAKFDDLEPRERRLLGILVALFCGFIVLIVPVTVVSFVGDLREENEQLRAVIARLQSSREQILERRAEHEAILALYEKPAPALAGYLSGLAKTNGIEIPELKDRTPVPYGKRYEELSTELSLKKVGMLNLTRFLESIAQTTYPINVTRLNIRKRGAETDSYDVSMTVSAFRRLDSAVDKKPAAKGERE